MSETSSESAPVTFDLCDHVEGPFYHGTKFTFMLGEFGKCHPAESGIDPL